MKLQVRVLMLLALSIPAFAWSQQLSIQPSTPNVRQTVHLVVPSTVLPQYDPSATLVSMASNAITVTVQLNGTGFGPPPPLDVVLGQFPSGGYDVTLQSQQGSGTTVTKIGTTHFNVVAQSSGQVMPLYDYTDLWWTPSESGWGLTITQHYSSNQIVAAWFTYGIDNQPIWYAMLGGTWTSPTSFSGPIYRASGPYFAGTFNPANVTVTQVGNGILSFSDYSHASFSFSADGQVGVKNIERQPF